MPPAFNKKGATVIDERFAPVFATGNIGKGG
jgi:hypothetical protein